MKCSKNKAKLIYTWFWGLCFGGNVGIASVSRVLLGFSNIGRTDEIIGPVIELSLLENFQPSNDLLDLSGNQTAW